jgi:hypothetical protein
VSSSRNARPPRLTAGPLVRGPRDVAGWHSLRKAAIRGWVRCSDGRLYHRVISEKASDSRAKKLKHGNTRIVDRARKTGKSTDNHSSEPGIPS